MAEQKTKAIMRRRKVLRDDFDDGIYNYEIELVVVVEDESHDKKPRIKVLSSKVKRSWIPTPRILKGHF